MSSSAARYSFFVQWHDHQADLIRRYMLSYYLESGEVEMNCIEPKRCFLRKTTVDGLSRDHFYKGAYVTILNRQLKIVDYGDTFTKNSLEKLKESSFMIIKPEAYQRMGQIISAVKSHGLMFTKMQMGKLTKDQAAQISAESAEALSSDVLVACVVAGDNATTQLAAYAAGEPGVYASADFDAAQREIGLVFNTWNLTPTALFNNCSLLFVRPHAMQHAGEIVNTILNANFEISAMQQFSVDAVNSLSFLEVYRGVLPEFNDIATEMSSGPLLAMEIRQKDCVAALREIVGPHDPEIAKHLRPDTIRAKYGQDRVKNAIHCTDLPEDGMLESEFFFRILQIANN